MQPALRHASAAFLILGAAVVGFVLFSQYVQGYEPCELCLRERWPWYFTMALGLIGVIAPSRWILALIGVTLLISAGLGFHHAGVELHWWEGPSACTGGNMGAHSVEELRVMMMRQTRVVQCDAVSWSFLGLSMAAYNGILSLIAGAAAIAFFVRSRHAH
jgi:disulfide bond formation protein DsbB